MIHWFYKRLTDKHLNGSLSGKQYEVLLNHLENCHQCKSYFDQQHQFESSILQAFSKYQYPANKPELIKKQVLSSPLETLRVERKGLKPFLNRRVLSFSAAAMIMSVMILLIWTLCFNGGRLNLAPIKIARFIGEGISYKQDITRIPTPVFTVFELTQGGFLQTDTASFAQVEVGNKIKVWLDKDTQVQFLPEKKTVLKVTKGQIYVEVAQLPNQYKFSTPAGDVLVHGTEFIIRVREDMKTQVDCSQGTVEAINTQGRVTIPSRYSSLLSQEQKPSNPQQLTTHPAAPWKGFIDNYGETDISTGPDWYPVYCFKKNLPDIIYNRTSRSIVSGSYDVWYLMGQDSMNKAIQLGYKLDDIPFFFSRSSSEGMVPVYELIHTYEAAPPYGMATIHFFTSSAKELAFDLNDINRWEVTRIMGYTYPHDSDIHRIGTWGLYSVARFGEKKFDAKMIYMIDSTLAAWEMKNNPYMIYQGSGTIASVEGKLIPPIRLSPSENKLIYDKKVQFIWKPVPHAYQYEIQISSRPDFAEYLISTTTNKTWTEGILPSGKWYWRVRSRSNYGIWGEYGIPGKESSQFQIKKAGNLPG